MQIPRSCFYCQSRNTCFGSEFQNRKQKKGSRKRKRPDNCSRQKMFATNSKYQVTDMGGSSWRSILQNFFLAINIFSSKSLGASDMHMSDIHRQHADTSTKNHHRFAEDLISEAVWNEFRNFNVSTSQKLSLTLDQHNFEEDLFLKYDYKRETSSLRGHVNPQKGSLNKQVHRSLRGKEKIQERFRKDRISGDFHFSESVEERHRLLISCKEIGSQEDCLSKLLRLYDTPYDRESDKYNGHLHHIELIHNLKFANALAVDVDAKTMGKIANDQEFVFEKDFVRGPLVLKDSITIYQPTYEVENRKLQDAQKIPWGLDAIRAQQVWREYGVKGKGVKICVLDSGVQASHEDFRQSNFDGYYGKEFVSPYWYEDNKGHGTHIAGTIAASDNTIGIVGIAPEAETYIVRVFDDNRNFYEFADGTTYSTDLIAAATICKEWGADIINASLGGKTYNRIEEEFFQDLYYKSGIVTVAASGNGGDNRNVYPAAYEGVLSVGAVDENMRMAEFSTWDPSTTDILAPGVNILSTFKENLYATYSGTSMAAPHATGTLALMLSYINKNQIDINRQDTLHTLKLSTSPVAISRAEEVSNEDDSSHKIGLVDAYTAIEYLENFTTGAIGRANIAPLDESSNRDCENEVHLNVVTDSKGGEIFYRLMRLSDNDVIWFVGPNDLENDSTYSEEACFDGPEDCYQFDIRDKGGDGISNGGGIEINYNGHRLYKGGNFGRGGVLKFGSCHD
mmetsp:Transcript_312/g.757  ORF Transcript_312/g.757 Transcript_312/m.757 type:complete len:736 (+) Transcript_312:192-2399(+)